MIPKAAVTRMIDRKRQSPATTADSQENTPTNPSSSPTFDDVVAQRQSRRSVLRGALVTSGLAAALSVVGLPKRRAQAADAPFAFSEIAHGVDENHHVAPGYSADVLIRWGDPVLPGAPPFDPRNQTAAAQAKQFGYNNDYVGYAPLPAGSGDAGHGLLCVNHEHTNEELMFPGLGAQSKKTDFAGMTQMLVDIEMAAHGGSVIEVHRVNDGKWRVLPASRYARRITANTAMQISGPAAGHPRLRTRADAGGRRVLGTIANCAGGMTPWGTYLMAEENFSGYFRGEADGHPEEPALRRHGIPGNWYAWGKFHDRFDLAKEPNEVNRFGWIVEVDPYDPLSVPIKRTALGRFKHEGAETIANKDGRIVVYSGDDQRFEYLYKFVSNGRFDPNDRRANAGLLDSGTLFAARFDADGTLAWLPLVFGNDALTPENGFDSQADVLISARLAADLLGATPMDRPEDVQPNPVTGKVYVMLTHNSKRKSGMIDAANPRGPNPFGHIIELSPPAGDHGALTCRWEILVRCGDPAADAGAKWNAATSSNGWFASPDNCAIDSTGNLWVCTDQGGHWAKSGTADGVWALETQGQGRGTGRMFFRVPVGAEICGPQFTPDDRTLFLAVQHPASGGTKMFTGFERASTFNDPATRWPDFDPNTPPRPSVLAITKDDGGRIGS